MALQIISVLLFTVFFSKALTLVCYNCLTLVPPGTCKQTANCSSNVGCNSITIYNGSNIGNNNWCANSSSCDNWSITLGRIRRSSLCCTSDLCNKATASDSENGLMCYTCNDIHCSNTQTQKCKGEENQCITTTVNVNNIISKGCASQNFCKNSTLWRNALLSSIVGNSILPNNVLLNNSQFQQLSMSSVSCCGANLCNNAPSMAQEAVLLLVPVLSSFLSI
ncbi:uncharacterized protein LOC125256960 [Megalobrama amblycephala]|uniref:uncharacterized protein LOC125256960 n=1 Tax=Megalobrama amblycephala TaxID=75352 RepID=UPI0020147640|nr:uncharacterized protein LOC125256960 [Megalobrama amblycephala]